MSEDLKSIEIELRSAMNLTLQGSYRRRAPSKRAVPLLEESRKGLEKWIEEHGESADALRLLALVNEAFLNYEMASQLLEKAIHLSPQRNRRDLKRLAAYREARQLFGEVKLSPNELALLGQHLKGKLLDSAPEKSLRWTESWLDREKPNVKSSIMNSLLKLGYASDYAVLHNLIPG